MQQGLGPASFDKMWLELKKHPQPLTAALESAASPSRGKAGWESLLAALDCVIKLGPGNVPNLISAVMDLNYDHILRQNYPDQYEDRLRGIERLAIYAERFETLPAFLESLALEESVFADTAAQSSYSDGQLTLSTIHSAKGKEWDAVFIIGMNQGHFPGGQMDSNLDEERRLFYVASTRARRFLYMSYGATSEGPSAFLRELPCDCYQLLDMDDGL